MKIELRIDGEDKVFTTPYVPVLAKRKYLKIQSEAEKRVEKDENYFPSAQEQLDEEDEIVGILANIVFGGQFTVNQVYEGTSEDYMYGKIREAIFGDPEETDDEDGEEGNDQGE